MPETVPPSVTAADRRASVARSLPPNVLDALEDLYCDDQRMAWLDRYAVVCRRNRTAMVFFALRDAGYPTR